MKWTGLRFSRSLGRNGFLSTWCFESSANWAVWLPSSLALFSPQFFPFFSWRGAQIGTAQVNSELRCCLQSLQKKYPWGSDFPLNLSGHSYHSPRYPLHSPGKAGSVCLSGPGAHWAKQTTLSGGLSQSSLSDLCLSSVPWFHLLLVPDHLRSPLWGCATVEGALDSESVAWLWVRPTCSY